MKKYKCKKGFILETYDDGGFWIPNKEKVVAIGDIYILDESGSTIIGGEVHLDGEDGSWIEISKESLAEFFDELI